MASEDASGAPDQGPDTTQGQPPRHGFQGDRTPVVLPDIPVALTIAISREAGARGGTIGRRVGQKLRWQVYDQELLEYLAQDGVAHQELLEHLPEAAGRWVDRQ